VIALSIFAFILLLLYRLFFIILYLIGGIIIYIIYSRLESVTEEDVKNARQGLTDENGQILALEQLDQVEACNLNLEYETLNKNVDERGNQTLLSGSIILAASFLVMLGALSLGRANILLLPFVILISLLLYGYWLTLFASTRKLDTISFIRMRAIEEIKHIRVHRLLNEVTQSKPLHQIARRLYMQVIFWILITFGIIILIFSV
jgi:hypothetical protein